MLWLIRWARPPGTLKNTLNPNVKLLIEDLTLRILPPPLQRAGREKNILSKLIVMVMTSILATNGRWATGKQLRYSDVMIIKPMILPTGEGVGGRGIPVGW